MKERLEQAIYEFELVKKIDNLDIARKQVDDARRVDPELTVIVGDLRIDNHFRYGMETVRRTLVKDLEEARGK